MKCLIVSNFFSDHGGGLEIILRQLAEHLVAVSKQEIEVEWIASAPAPNYVAKGIACTGMRSWNWLEDKTGLPMPLWNLRDLPKLVRQIRQADLILLNDCLYVSSLLTWLLALCFGKKIVLIQHIDEISGETLPARWIQRLMRAGYWFAGKVMMPSVGSVVFYSAKVEGYFKKRFPGLKNTVMIRNGVAVEVFKPDERRTLAARPRILFAGRFVPRKGLEIMYWLARRFPGCDWIFAGWGVIDPHGWGLQNVHVKGKCEWEQMVDLYQTSDLLVLPSTGEGFPLVVQEAISCGLPVLVTAETASGDPAASGFLMTADLDRKSFESAVNAFLARRAMELDSHVRQRRHEFAVSQWSWVEAAKKYQQLFNQLLTKGAS